GKVTGTFSGDRGSGEIRNGSFSNSELEFTITVTGQQATETGDWIFRGTVRDSAMDGTVTTTQGTFQFTGSKTR
ncbi:MAG TPA: hypothetical protein VFL80_09370, partial [Thermoanaerobaculia bacterium]|nr:hypothetical protein [Thermoanaerobaculia bacterium]